jgi:putative mRNA 3-end processing factor
MNSFRNQIDRHVPIFYEYLRVHHHDPRCSILLTGYQGEETNGRLLLETGDVYIDGLRKKVKCEVKQFDFSAHDGRSQLKNIVRTIKPKKVMFIHGDGKTCLALKEWAMALVTFSKVS